MHVERYEMVQEISGTWAIFDTLTGMPADHDSRILIGLRRGEAEAFIKAGIKSRVSVFPTLPPKLNGQ